MQRICIFIRVDYSSPRFNLIQLGNENPRAAALLLKILLRINFFFFPQHVRFKDEQQYRKTCETIFASCAFCTMRVASTIIRRNSL